MMAALALAGWRQGAIRAAFTTVSVLLAGLLALPLGKLLHPLLSHMGASNPVLAWALAPVVGFMAVTIAISSLALPLHKRVEHFYKYEAGDLRLALWERLNARLGICLGLLNGMLYFVFVTFLVFNLSYWTIQVSTAEKQPTMIRLANQLGNDLQATGLSRMANGVGTLRPEFYDLADLSGFILNQKDPQFGRRLMNYPALTSLWERSEFNAFMQDELLTNALTSGVALGDLFNDPVVQNFLANKEQTDLVRGILTSNLVDFTNYLATGKSPKYDGQKIIGRWEFNPAVTMAWMRQSRPKMPASEMRAMRAWMTQAFAQTQVLMTGDNQVFIKNFPRLKTLPGQAPTTEFGNWKGDWSASGATYDIHMTYGSEEKFMSASAEDLRLTIKDGKSLMIFDRAD